MAQEISVQGIGADLALTDEFLNQLQTGIDNAIAQTHVGAGKPFIRLLKDGSWVYGPSNEEVQEGSSWVLNLMSFGHGWCCWVDGGANKNELKGEAMGSVFQPRPAQPLPIEGTPFAEQFSFELKCLDGDDEGAEVLYKTASYGGKSAVVSLLDAIRKRAATERVFVFPVLELQVDHYNHSKWGKTYTPVFEIVGWANANGELSATEELTEVEAPAPEPAKKAAAAAPQRVRKSPVAPAPASTQQARAASAGPARRRPGR